MEQPNKYKVIVSERSTQMLISHAAFLAKVSPEAAEKLVCSFEQAANSLEVMPQRCPWITTEYIPRNQYRSLIFGKQYLIIFQMKEETVYIDYIVDCRQDYDWLIR